jgi:sugar-specific transcriptional regulator TrmB
MGRLNLTHFGFTPTESLVYEVLLTGGPGTGYAIARTAGLARANAYSALEGLVAKGAARVDAAGRPKRYRPEAPAALIARISTDHGLALERLSSDLEAVSVPATPTLVEVESGRAVLQLITHDVARAAASVALLVPPDAYPLIAPALRRPYSAGLPLLLCATGPVDLGFAPVEVVRADRLWPGMPIISVVDDRSALMAARQGADVRGHWSTAAAFVAGARLALERFRDAA